MDEKASASRLPERDRPWVMRTYAGHSSAAATNALFRRNLAKGQTGLSVAFDLPTQTGYDPDHELASGEVGRVGVPVAHLGDMRALFDGIPLAEMNTSMTINAPAMWLLALYGTVGLEQDAELARCAGTTQNDIIKEYLSRGTYIFPPAASLRLTADVVAYTLREMPRWNPVNICSYHLQEAGATPVQEVGFALATAVAVLDAVRDSGQVPAERMGDVVQRISFFVNAGVRFVEEIAKMRAFGVLWDEITRDRYGVTEAKQRRFRYGVQVNSLGLTEAQPENNIQRIVLEMLGVTMSRDARARAVQLPAWNEALGLPRPWDQQWSLRMQQVLAYESDLLEYPDIFAGSHVMTALVDDVVAGARVELDKVLELGGVVAAVETGYLKSALVASLAERRRRMESGADVVVGVNRYVETEPSPLTAAGAEAVEQVDPAVEAAAVDGVRRGVPNGTTRQWTRHWPSSARTPRPPPTSCRQPSPVYGPALPPASGPARCARSSASTGHPQAWPAASARAATRVSWRSVSGSPPPPGSWAAGACGCWSASPAWTDTQTARNRSRYAPATPASRSSTRASG